MKKSKECSAGSMFDAVREFHGAFGHPVADFPCMLDRERVEKRVSWLQEELDELSSAPSLVDQVDALADIIYFAFGTFVEIGVRPEVIFQQVHEANMAKLGPDGRPIFKTDGKIGKPEGWIGPEQRISAEIMRATLSDFLRHRIEDTTLFVAKDENCLLACIAAAAEHIRERQTEELKNMLEELGAKKKTRAQAASDLEVGLSVDVDLWNSLESVKNLSLRFSYIRVNHFEEWEIGDVIRQNWIAGRVVIATISAGRLLNHDKEDIGHAILITRLNGDRLTYLDLASDHFGHFDLSLDDLYGACRAREGGILCVSDDIGNGGNLSST